MTNSLPIKKVIPKINTIFTAYDSFRQCNCFISLLYKDERKVDVRSKTPIHAGWSTQSLASLRVTPLSVELLCGTPTP